MKGRERLLATLAEHGVTEADYRKVEKARQLVDEVNAALAGRDSNLVYAVTMAAASTVPGRADGPGPSEILES